METKPLKTFKLLKEGDARFYIKSFSNKDYNGKLLISPKNNKTYIKGAFRVTDSEGVSETIYKVFSLEYKRDIIKLLRCIGKPQWEEYITRSDFEWEDFEDEAGLCRIENKENERYGIITSIESFVKKDMDSINPPPPTVQAMKSSGLNNTLASPTFTMNNCDIPIDDDLPF